jgi:hypothetical protein
MCVPINPPQLKGFLIVDFGGEAAEINNKSTRYPVIPYRR